MDTAHIERPYMLVHLLMHVGKRMRDRVREDMQAIGLHRGQGHLMSILGYSDGWAQKDLARAMHVAPATLSVMLQRMTDSGLVERRPDPDDERVQRVFLTPAGRDTFRQAEASWAALNDEIMACFRPEEAMLMRRFLEGLLAEPLQVRD